MSQRRDLNPAWRPPHIRTFTDIHAPRIQEEMVNGKTKCSLTPAKPGVITIYSDDEVDNVPASRPQAIKREGSQTLRRAVGYDHHSSQPRIKKESPLETGGRKQSRGQPSPAVAASVSRRTQVDGPIRQPEAQGTDNSSTDSSLSSSSSSDSSGSDSSESSDSEVESDASESEEVFDSSSDSSSSDESSSDDDGSISVYRPSTRPSSFDSSPARTRRTREANGPTASTNPETDSPTRRSSQNGPPMGSRPVALDFFIPVTARPVSNRPGQVSGPRSQTLPEQPSVELHGAEVPPKNGPSFRYLRPATPGPSSRRLVPPQPSPGVFVTPRAESVTPSSSSSSPNSPRSVSQSRGKRPMDQTEDLESASKVADLERMAQRIRNQERQMEQQRTKLAQMEATKRLVAELKIRIDGLEQRERRRAEEPVRGRDVRTRVKERNEAHLKEAAPPHVARRRDSPRPSERREGGGRCNVSRIARAPLCEQEHQRMDQERQEHLELEQQLEQDQHQEVERRRSRATSRDNADRASAQIQFESEYEAQARVQHEVFTRPLSGHDLDITFDDDDRPHVSKATAFLLRVPQAFVLRKLRQFAKGRPFFDLAHPSSVRMGCWVVSRQASCDSRMRLTESKETHNFSFERLAVRIWHDEQSIYSLMQHGKRARLAIRICRTDTCMRPDHVVVEPNAAAAERRRCKREGRCRGHTTVHKDGARQVRKRCIFLPRGHLR